MYTIWKKIIFHAREISQRMLSFQVITRTEIRDNQSRRYYVSYNWQLDSGMSIIHDSISTYLRPNETSNFLVPPSWDFEWSYTPYLHAYL